MVRMIKRRNSGPPMRAVLGPFVMMKLFILTHTHTTQLGSSIKMDVLIPRSCHLNREFLVQAAGTHI